MSNVTPKGASPAPADRETALIVSRLRDLFANGGPASDARAADAWHTCVREIAQIGEEALKLMVSLKLLQDRHGSP